jgi:hypothetical protein
MKTKLTEAELRPMRRLSVGARRSLEEVESYKGALREAGLSLHISYCERLAYQRAFVNFNRSGLQVARWAIHSGKLTLYRPYGQKEFHIRDGKEVAAFVIQELGKKAAAR